MSEIGRLFVLGAGFSRPAGMPLATELTLPLIQRASLDGEIEEMLDWLKGFHDRIASLREDAPQAVNVEELFEYGRIDAELFRSKQHACNVGRHHGDTPWSHAEAIDTWLLYLEEALVDEMLEAQRRADPKALQPWLDQLLAGDRVATFNYDMLVEDGIRDRNGVVDYGTGEQVSEGASLVLKLHGSIDWIAAPRGTRNGSDYELLFEKADVNSEEHGAEPTSDEIEWHHSLHRVCDQAHLHKLLKDRDLHYQGQEIYPGLAGLGSHKMIHRLPGLGFVWLRLAESIFHATKLIFIGFSFSDFDRLARWVFAETWRQRREKSEPCEVIVIDPSANSTDFQQRYKSVFGNAVQFRNVRHEQLDWSEL